MLIKKLVPVLFAGLLAVAVSLPTSAQNETVQAGVIESVNASTGIIIISEVPYVYNAGTILTNSESLEPSNLTIADFGPGTIVQFETGSSSELRYLRMFLP